MLNCRKVFDRLDDYVSRSLSWREWLGIAFHLMLCLPCRRYLKTYRQTVELVQVIDCEQQAAEVRPLDEGLVRRILARREQG